MLVDISPAARPIKKVTMLATTRGSTDGSLFFDSKISFFPFVNYLKDKLTGSSNTTSKIYNYLIERLEADPALLRPVEDINLLNENQDLLELLGTALFPVISEQGENIFAMAVPYQFAFFNYSTPFRKLFTDEREE